MTYFRFTNVIIFVISFFFLRFVINPYSYQNTWPFDSVSRVRILARKRTHLVILDGRTLCPNSLFRRQTISPCLVRPGTTMDLQNRPVEEFEEENSMNSRNN